MTFRLMGRRLFWCAVAALAMASPANLVGDQPTTEPDKAAEVAADPRPPEAQDVVLFSPGRALLVRLLIRIDGRPFQEAWTQRLDKVLSETNSAEAATFDSKQAAAVVSQMIGELGGGPPVAETADAAAKLAKASGDKLPRQQLVAFLLVNGPPFVVQHSASIARRAGPALFPLLDANRDGQLSAEELAGAEAALRCRDFDDDGLITQQELIVDPQLAALEAAGQASPDSSVGKALLAVEPGEGQKLAKALLAHYDSNRDERLALVTSPELQLEEPLVQLLDINHDGALDAAELAKFGERPADFELRFDFGKVIAGGGGRSFRNTPDDVIVRKKLDGGYKITLPEAEIAWHRSNRNPAQSAAQDLRFSMFDPDNNGYIDDKEAKNNPFIARSFAAMDADHDGKVMRAEFRDYLERESRSSSVRVLLEVFDQGQDLFSILDTSGDGLLTPRELRAAPTILSSADTNRDGVLGGSEIPQQLTLEISRGLVTRANEVRSARNPAAAATLKPGKGGPPWFRGMDRNNDGDIAHSEFLGPSEVFDKLDANHDGLLDESEAKAAK